MTFCQTADKAASGTGKNDQKVQKKWFGHPTKTPPADKQDEGDEFWSQCKWD